MTLQDALWFSQNFGNFYPRYRFVKLDLIDQVNHLWGVVITDGVSTLTIQVVPQTMKGNR